MDDSGPRYLINQFNKYASWRLTRWNYPYPILTLLVATMALFYSLTGTYQAAPLLAQPYSDITTSDAWVFFFAMVLVSGFVIGRYSGESTSFRECLVILEDYRFKHKRPRNMIFNAIVEGCPEQLESF